LRHRATCILAVLEDVLPPPVASAGSSTA